MPPTATSRKKKTNRSTTSRKSTAQPDRGPIYYFGRSRTDGSAADRALLGGKGANLAEMSSTGLPVPPGFTITAEMCEKYEQANNKMPRGLMDGVRRHVALLEEETGKSFGSDTNPLLVSVRSGAAVSMPGMMDTVLNLGLNEKAIAGLIKTTSDERFAYDAYRRLINMFGDVVMGIEHELFEEAFDRIKRKHKASVDTEVPAEGLRALCEAYKGIYSKHVGEEFPQDPYQQLKLSIEAVFRSWNAPRAVRYRQINEITGLRGTAVNVQTMVYGNMGDDSATGVAFTRNPSTGEDRFYGEFLVNAQGEDVVAGIRTPKPIIEMQKWNAGVYKQLLKIKDTLEHHYRDMQDIEFTIERGELFILQTRTGKRTGEAAVRIGVDMVKAKVIDIETALLRIPAEDLTQMLLPSFSDEDKEGATIVAKGLPASPGAATGRLAFTAGEAVERTLEGERVLLVRKETSPEDIDGMHHAVGILTSTGGMTSHAAVVARGWGKCCVVGAGELQIDARKRMISVNGRKFTHKDVLSIDGSTGEIMIGELSRSVPELSGNFNTVMKWADKHRTLGVRTNADTPADAARARDFGAEGIGLCRTEHMFFEGVRINAMREMILAETDEERQKALEKLLPYQRDDFIGIFKEMSGRPVTVRLLDPPLHEFIPNEQSAQKELAAQLDVPLKKVQRRVAMLHELNPMLGHRGCRLAVTYPAILEMQVTAIVEAAIECRQQGVDARPEIMIPLIGTHQELSLLRGLIEKRIAEVKKQRGHRGKLPIAIGTMIEIPRAALTADEIAPEADFFSFGTNDLTQLAYGFSRDDINSFLPDYLEQEILPRDPFQSLDVSGVGQLVEMAVVKGRATKAELKLGICGEHGGDPQSIRFFHRVGLDYVSCSPYRVPVARLVAAQAAIESKRQGTDSSVKAGRS